MAPLNCILEIFYRYFNYYSIFNICSIPSNILLSQASLGCLKTEISPSETACGKESTMRLHKTKGLSKETDFVQKRQRGWKVLKRKDCKEEQCKRWLQGHQIACALFFSVYMQYSFYSCWWKLLNLFQKEKPCFSSFVL